MRKLILHLSCCFICTQCFPQVQAIKDSSKIVSVSDSMKPAPPPGRKPELSIYPNPANNKITLRVKNYIPGMANVKVLDTKGKLVKEDNRLLTNGTEEIIMFLLLKPGIFFILVSQPGKLARKKLVML